MYQMLIDFYPNKEIEGGILGKPDVSLTKGLKKISTREYFSYNSVNR